MRRLLMFVVLAAPLVASWRWMRDWGVSEADACRVMPGDDWVPRPGYEVTRGVDIAASAAHVWPWLVQIGKGRGGLYSFDFLDRLFGYLDAPSADRILPEFQQLAVGDVIPLGRGAGFPVHAIDERRALVLAGEEGGLRWTWQFGLYPLADGGTRLVSRNRATVRGLPMRLFLVMLLDPAAFVMTRQMLINLKGRAERLEREGLRAADSHEESPAASPASP
jgi:hypothetical protein